MKAKGQREANMRSGDILFLVLSGLKSMHCPGSWGFVDISLDRQRNAGRRATTDGDSLVGDTIQRVTALGSTMADPVRILTASKMPAMHLHRRYWG